MIFLCLSILCSTLNHLIFKAFQRLDVIVLPALVTNYLVCVLVGYLSMAAGDSGMEAQGMPLIALAGVQGGLLIGSFFLLSLTTRKNGVGVTALATRLAVVIPTTAAFFLYGDAANPLKLVGIAVALFALYLSSVEKRPAGPVSRGGLQILPLALFAAFGINLLLAKYVQAYHLLRVSYHEYLVAAFGFAFLAGLTVLGYRTVLRGDRFGVRDLAAGVLLGVNNYGSLYFLFRTLGRPGWESSVVFPTISASVVMMSFIGARLLFRETVSRRRVAALCAGVFAIVLINA